MSLATSIKEFSDILSDLSNVKGFTDTIPKSEFWPQVLIFSAKSLGSGIFYLLSFQWLRDVSYLPLLIPEISPYSFFGDQNLAAGPEGSHLFSFSQSTSYATDQLLAGLVNSFFFSLPLSLPHLISIRRLFFEGTVAAAASIFGTILAHSIFLMSIVYGLRFIIIPWFSLEPLNYIVGVVAVAISLWSMSQQSFRLVPIIRKGYLIKICVLNFILTWCEETVIFHSLNNLTLNTQSTYLDLYPSSGALDSFIVHTTYLLAFVLGNCVFSALFYYLILLAGENVRDFNTFSHARTAKIFNKLLMFLIAAFTLSSFPYYGLDYLFMNALGFLPEDPIYEQTLFSPTAVTTKAPHLFKEMPPQKMESFTPLNLDLNYFDRGMYLNAPTEFPEGKGKEGIPNPNLPTLSFEELNYRGEYAWVMRHQVMKELVKKRTSIFTKMMTKQRNKYDQYRALAEKRRAQSPVKARMKSKTVGSTSEWKEGVLPGEPSQLFLKISKFLGHGFLLPKQVQSEMREFITPGTELSSDRSNLEISSEEGEPKRLIQPTSRQKNEMIDPIQEEVDFEQEFLSDYSKGFTPPYSLSYDRVRARNIPTRIRLKKRYYLNPIYRSLLQTDIDNFLARQPAAFKLTSNQEYELYQKRKMLEKYYNWLRYYEPFTKMIQMRFEIPDSLSFVDRVYHQQFKGTLKIAKRLFNVTFDSKENRRKKRVLSYDQLLYKDSQLKGNPILHEELNQDLLGSKINGHKAIDSKNDQLTLIEKIDSDGVNQDNTTHISQSKGDHDIESNDSSDDEIYEEETSLIDKASSKYIEAEDSPFIEESNSSPIYAGWDDVLRRFVITNNFTVKQE